MQKNRSFSEIWWLRIIRYRILVVLRISLQRSGKQASISGREAALIRLESETR